jgi:hypothetical protein
MNTVLADLGLIWRHAVAPRMLRKIAWTVCALLAIGAGLFAYHVNGGEPGPRETLLLVLPWFYLGVIYWFDLVLGALRQDTPANAKLVPRLRLRAMQLVGTYWLVFTLLITLVLGASFGHRAMWAAATATWLLGAAMARVGLRYGMLLMFVPMIAMLLPHPASLAMRELAATPAGVAACGLWIVLLAWYGKGTLFPSRDRHQDLHITVEKGVRQSQAACTSNRRTSLYAAVLGRVRRNRTSAGELVLHSLGPDAHWSVSANMAAIMAAVLVAGRVSIELIAADGKTLVPFVGGFMIVPLLLTFAQSPQRITTRASMTQGEQALLRMAPVVARMDHYNRELGSALLRRALIEWVLVTLVLVAVTFAVSAPRDVSLLQFAVCCLAMPLTTVVLRDYARKPALSASYLYVAAIYLVMAGGAAYYAMLRSSVVPVAVVCIIAGIGATAWLAASRRRTMIAAPVAFPAGRLAA